jgi:hypothetical protein
LGGHSAILETQFHLGGNAMCDYSLAHFPNRLAVEGEQLVVRRFSSGTLGLASSCRDLNQLLFGSRTPAVCIPPGARLILQDIPEYLQGRLEVGAVEKVAFVEQSADAFTYRDALRFSNGREVLLQDLQCGQRVDVVSLRGAEEELLGSPEHDSERSHSFALMRGH